MCIIMYSLLEKTKGSKSNRLSYKIYSFDKEEKKDNDNKESRSLQTRRKIGSIIVLHHYQQLNNKFHLQQR